MRGLSKAKQNVSLQHRQMAWFKLKDEGATDDQIIEMLYEGVNIHFKISRIKLVSMFDFPWVKTYEHVQLVDANFEDEEKNWIRIVIDDIASIILRGEYKIKDDWGSSRVSPLIS